jgi:hypothetical protein
MEDMPELRACLDCGHRLSSEAKACTACKTQFPFGVTCYICKQVLAAKDSMTWYGSIRGHLSCVKERLKIPTRCHACEAALPAIAVEAKMILPVGWGHEVCASC